MSLGIKGLRPRSVIVPSMTNLRYRCENCGNVTRFDVTRTQTTKSFYHYSLGGELSIEGQVILADDVSEVSCRWCSTPKSVVEVYEETDE